MGEKRANFIKTTLFLFKEKIKGILEKYLPTSYFHCIFFSNHDVTHRITLYLRNLHVLMLKSLKSLLSSVRFEINFGFFFYRGFFMELCFRNGMELSFLILYRYGYYQMFVINLRPIFIFLLITDYLIEDLAQQAEKKNKKSNTLI